MGTVVFSPRPSLTITSVIGLVYNGAMPRLAWLFLCCPLLLAQEPPLFQIKADYVKVPVSVFDTNGQILSNLTREQFILLDENEGGS